LVIVNTSILLRVCVHAPDESVRLPDVGDTGGIHLETRVVAQVLAAHRGQEAMPMFPDCDVDRDIAIIGGIDVERRARGAAVVPVRGGTLPDCQ
jgi:hypothetical protein